MSHTAGMDMKKVQVLTRAMLMAIGRSGCTISEGYEALHEANMALLKAALRPFEPFTCPTCPKTEDLTPAKLSKIQDVVRKEMQK